MLELSDKTVTVLKITGASAFLILDLLFIGYFIWRNIRNKSFITLATFFTSFSWFGAKAILERREGNDGAVWWMNYVDGWAVTVALYYVIGMCWAFPVLGLCKAVLNWLGVQTPPSEARVDAILQKQDDDNVPDVKALAKYLEPTRAADVDEGKGNIEHSFEQQPTQDRSQQLTSPSSPLNGSSPDSPNVVVGTANTHIAFRGQFGYSFYYLLVSLAPAWYIREVPGEGSLQETLKVILHVSAHVFLFYLVLLGIYPIYLWGRYYLGLLYFRLKKDYWRWQAWRARRDALRFCQQIEEHADEMEMKNVDELQILVDQWRLENREGAGAVLDIMEEGIMKARTKVAARATEK